MIVVSSAVESDQLVLEQLFDKIRSRIYHPMTRLVVALELPVYQKKIRKHLNVEEHELLIRISIFHCIRRLLRTELHLGDFLNAVISVIRAVGSEGKNGRSHVCHVEMDASRICVIQNLVDEVDRWFGAGMDLLVKVLRNECP